MQINKNITSYSLLKTILFLLYIGTALQSFAKDTEALYSFNGSWKSIAGIDSAVYFASKQKKE